jgi:hypothetical protein
LLFARHLDHPRSIIFCQNIQNILNVKIYLKKSAVKKTPPMVPESGSALSRSWTTAQIALSSL